MQHDMDGNKVIGDVFLLGAQSEARTATLKELASSRFGPDCHVVWTDCEQHFAACFDTIRKALGPIFLRKDCPAEAFSVFLPEVLAVWPELREEDVYSNAATLEDISLGGTKRRLHKDSEQLFRIMHGIVSQLFELMEGLRDLAGRKLLFVLDNFDAADRLSINLFYHLQNRRGARGIYLLAALDLAWLETPQIGTGPWLWLDGVADADAQALALYADACAEHRATLENLIHHPSASQVQAPDADRRPISNLASPAPDLYAKLLSLGAPGAVTVQFTGTEYLSTPPDLTRARRAAIRAGLSGEERAGLHRSILARPHGTFGIREHRLIAEAYHTLLGGDVARAKIALLSIIQHGFAFSMNFQVMLLAAARLHQLYRDGNPKEPMWIALLLLEALTHCYLEKHQVAIDKFNEAKSLCKDRTVCAQVHFYIGLILAKCLARLDDAEVILQEGRTLVEAAAGRNWAAALEYGWNSNALAFCLWRRGESKNAEAVVARALILAQQYDHPQLKNLAINLINNLSVLREEAGDFDAALGLWSSLENLNAMVTGGRFSKSYHYRRGWLRLKQDDYAAALDEFLTSYNIARTVNDHFHMDLISDACGYTAVKLGQYDLSLRWYETNARLCWQLGDGQGVAQARFHKSVVRSLKRGGLEITFNDDDWAIFETFGLSEAVAHKLTEIRGALSDFPAKGLTAHRERLIDMALSKPKMKLSTPFALAHMASAASKRSWIHVSLRERPLQVSAKALMLAE